MTREEARQWFLKVYSEIKGKGYVDENEEAYELAIKALEQETCDYAINRQAVLEIFGYVMDYWKEHAIDVEPHEIEDALIGQYEFTAKKLSELPPVTPQQKMGKWLYKEITDDYRVKGQCSECKERKIIDNYCPNCGAKMIELQESEE